jgi:hypothetical protein
MVGTMWSDKFNENQPVGLKVVRRAQCHTDLMIPYNCIPDNIRK